MRVERKTERKTPPPPKKKTPFPLPTQIYAQINYFLKDPIKNDVAYQARAQPFLVFGLLCTGLAIGHHNAGL